MKKIPLTQGKFAMVDDEDFHYLNRFNWMYWETDTGFYPAREIGKRVIPMHHFILPSKKSHYLRHKNNDALDNRKENMESISTNHRRHLGLKKRLGASIYRGVQKNSMNTWRVVIAKDKIRYFIGNFTDEREGAIAYNEKAKELYGEFAYQNIIPE